MGLTSAGFVPRTVQEIITGIESRLKAVFGDSFDVTPSSPDGQIIGVIAQECWQQEQNAFATFQTISPSLASGVSLDYVVAYNKIKRIVNRPCKVTLILNGTSGTRIPTGTSFGTQSGLVFKTNYEVFLPATVRATCTTLGDFNVNIGEVSKLVDTLAGLASCNNEEQGDRGITYESDAQLRARREISIEAQGVHSVGTILSSVAELGVTHLNLIENFTNATVDGVPPHSFETIVSGGEPRQIAIAISGARPLGIQAFGAEVYNVPDSLGQVRPIGLTRPQPKQIYLKVVGVKEQGATNDLPVLVGDALVKHINSLGVGVDVIWSKLFAPISNIQGLSVTSIFVGFAAGPTGTATLPIAARNYADTKKANIVIDLVVA